MPKNVMFKACGRAWRRGVLTALFTVGVGFRMAAATADDSDWPMWRYDSGRGGASPHELSSELFLHWSRDLGPVRRAWPQQVDDFEKLEFDASYTPVVAGDTMYVGSMTADRLTAYDIESGAEKWRYYADGPVRMAPVVWQGRVYFTSDDSHLYCLDASSGEEFWRFRGGPSDRTVLGNERLINMWPARGGPVIADGKVYFIAGIWPFEGIFVHALDAGTGRLEWTNSGDGSDFNQHQHPGAFAYGGVSPQGCLAVSGDKLIVPGGRTPPAVFDRHTGALLYFHQSHDMIGGAAGGWRVYASGDWYVNTRDKQVAYLYNLADGAQFGYYNIQIMSDTAFFGVWKETITTNRWVPVEAAVVDLPQLDGDENIRKIAAGNGVVAQRSKEITVTQWLPFAFSADVTRTAEKVENLPPRQAVQKQYKLQTLWDARAAGAMEDFGLERLHIKAGSTLYGSGRGGRLFAIGLEPPDGPPEELKWTGQVQGEVFDMLAARDRLFVVTRQGVVYCFGPDRRDAVSHPYQPEPIPERDGENSNSASVILDSAKASKGYALLFGLGDGRMLEEMLSRTELHVIAVDQDPARVADCRRKLDAAGLYGIRAAVHCGNPLSYRFPPYIAELIVVDDCPAGDDVALAKAIFNPLRPYGGVAFVSMTKERQAAFAAAKEKAGLANAELTAGGDYVLLRRTGRLPGSGQWTHQHADAANTTCSSDRLVKAPVGVLWFGGPTNDKLLPRHMGGPIPQVSQGRIVLLGVNHISARCVYTGRELWARELPLVGENFTSLEDECRLPAFFPLHPGSAFIGSPFVSCEDSVYVIHRDKCLRLDLETGDTLNVMDLPAPDALAQSAAERDGEGQDASGGMFSAAVRENVPWGFISLLDDMLIAGAYPHYYGEGQPGRSGNWNSTSSEFLLGMDRRTGEIRWVRHARYGFRHNAIASAAGRTFAMDNLSKTILDKMARRGVVPDAKPFIMALDARTGKTLWTYDKLIFGTWLAYSEKHDILFQAGRPGGAWNPPPDEPGGRIVALRGSDGSELWQRQFSYTGPLMLHQGLDRIIESRSGMSVDLLAGTPVMRENPVSGNAEPWKMSRHYGCGTMIASGNLLTFRSGAAAYYDLSCDSGTANLGGFRTGCTVNLLAADGVLCAPDYTRTCTCSYQNQTSLGFVHMPEVEMWTLNAFSNAPPGAARRIGINFGAPGSRLADDRVLWAEYPHTGGRTPVADVNVAPADNLRWFRDHSSYIKSADGSHAWVAASGVEGVLAVRVDGLALENADSGAAAKYTVKLHFAEPLTISAGERVFDVIAQGDVVAEGVDVVAQAGGPRTAVVVAIEDVVPAEGAVPGAGAVEIEFEPADTDGYQPFLCGMEILFQE